ICGVNRARLPFWRGEGNGRPAELGEMIGDFLHLLAMALMGLKLWELASLALPMLAILVVQTIFMALYAIFVTWRMMGKNYDAAVLAAGHCD
ncbi:sodium/glutamate symporter, partial [Escherichia coli]|uniref:sodium/glutamate symporter n=1 Tax=Escherichia coli TaxID=562 RepID=UPI0025A1915C